MSTYISKVTFFYFLVNGLLRLLYCSGLEFLCMYLNSYHYSLIVVPSKEKIMIFNL